MCMVWISHSWLILFYRCLVNRQNIFPLEPRKALNASAAKFIDRYGNVSERFRFEIILDPIRRAFLQPGMNNSRSLLLLHYNQHMAKILKLSQWKRLVDELISMLKNRHKLFGSETQILWKTMTAIGHKMPYYPIKGKYHTAFVSIIHMYVYIDNSKFALQSQSVVANCFTALNVLN